MTRKDYEAIAGALADAGKYTESFDTDDQLIAGAVLRIVRAKIAEVLRAENPRFDAGRFLDACKK